MLIFGCANRGCRTRIWVKFIFPLPSPQEHLQVLVHNRVISAGHVTAMRTSRSMYCEALRRPCAPLHLPQGHVGRSNRLQISCDNGEKGKLSSASGIPSPSLFFSCSSSFLHGTVKWQVDGLGCLWLFYSRQTICRPSFHSHTLRRARSHHEHSTPACACALCMIVTVWPPWTSTTLPYPTLPYRKLPYLVAKYTTTPYKSLSAHLNHPIFDLPTGGLTTSNKLFRACSNHCATPASSLSFFLRLSF